MLQVAGHEQDWPVSEGHGRVKMEVDLAVAMPDDASSGFLGIIQSLQDDQLLCDSDQYEEAGALCVGRGQVISDGCRPTGLHHGKPSAPPADAEPAEVITSLH